MMPPCAASKGLPEQCGVLAGEEVREVVVEENGVKMCFDLLHGQKTGGFLDQRENRAAAANYARGRALDCFTYTGGFALALAPHCDRCWAWILRRTRCSRRERNQGLNGFANVEWKEANCFDFLKAADQEKQRFDTVVIDPPAFARQKSNLDSALRGYKELNLRALKILNPGGYLITCSCSFHVSEADLLEVIAERRAGCPPHGGGGRAPHAVARPSHSAHRAGDALLEVPYSARAVVVGYETDGDSRIPERSDARHPGARGTLVDAARHRGPRTTKPLRPQASDLLRAAVRS